jgi:hypothetical protein
MADGRICAGIGFTQIKPDLRGASMPDRRDHSSAERAGYRVQGHVELSPSVTKRPCPGCSFAGNSFTVNREQ